MAAERTVLLEDPLRPGVAAVIRSGPFLFLSGVDGDKDGKTGRVEASLFGDGPAQARNAYQTVVDRLCECGYDGSAAVRIEHATASQDWRLARMALWPELFGVPTQAVSQGYQGKMAGQNMITVTTIATTGAAERAVITPGPNPGRASRISRCGPFLFVIGVRGQHDLATGDAAEEETSEAFAQQVRFAYRNIDHHLAAAGAARDGVVRFDAFVRDAARVPDLRRVEAEHFGGPAPVATTVVGCPLGGRSDLELSAIALVPGGTKAVGPAGMDDVPATVRAGGFVFVSGVAGHVGADGRRRADLCGELVPQLHHALDRLEAALDSAGTDHRSLVRLDVYLRDQHRGDVVQAWLSERFRGDAPTVTVHGVELGPGAEAALSAIAADPRG